MKTKPESGERFTAWITKYALTSGILTREVEVRQPGMVRGVDGAFTTYYHAPDWHRTEAEAHARVRQMIAAKRKSLAKQMAKLDDLERRLGPQKEQK